MMAGGVAIVGWRRYPQTSRCSNCLSSLSDIVALDGSNATKQMICKQTNPHGCQPALASRNLLNYEHTFPAVKVCCYAN